MKTNSEIMFLVTMSEQNFDDDLLFNSNKETFIQYSLEILKQTLS